MSIQNAKKFIELVKDNTAFRKEMYKVNGLEGLNKFLREKELTFSEDEFEEAYSLMMFKCQLAEEHDELENTVNLIKLVVV
ncbi:Nif11-like leader peptide family natural product precursor [Saccharicrinis fermentans]|uniref:Nif11-like leader peptide domain protein n=1 Tax=Saccharicrinis fermentans DSM 9555 = JCM 21142 TaxID=869213 RepID=W7YMC9_9BACT|nr:Nif11-like leader peptide family natural product precursor [Saccharicrinis fermentans]GAF03554.1 Nif11-like leader peptide domain protein [Saccharicrinis fermentans DSM 9555 = JCM 21142]